MRDLYPAAAAARTGAPAPPKAVDLTAFLNLMHGRTGAPMSVVKLAFRQLIAASDLIVEPDPLMPSGWRVTPCPGLARHLDGGR